MKNKNSFNLNITETAANHINHITNDPVAIGLRLTAHADACDGYVYDYTLVSAVTNGDLVINSGVSSLIIPEDSAVLLDGSTLDYIEHNIGGQFVITNPSPSCSNSFG